VPINMALRRNSDAGDPTANFTGAPQLAGELENVVRNLAGRISVRSQEGATAQPTLSVH
jgi:ATP-binding protein involved in chromosome partitioning